MVSLMLRGFNFRRAGWVLAIFGISVPAVLLPIYAWFSRKDSSAFNTYVGWAGILALTVSALGVVLLMVDKVGALGNLSPARMPEIAEELARNAMRQDGLLLAQLLSTDTLDSRAARGNFRPEKPYGRRKVRGKRSGLATREFAEIVDFYLNETRRRMVILGAPGTGKTVLTVSLTVGLMKRRAAASSSEGRTIPVPCLFSLPSWDPAFHDLTNWLETQIVDRFRVTRKIATQLVRDGWILPVLDGLDEMDLSEAMPRRSESAVAHINDYIACTPGSQIVVVCRSGSRYYERLVRRVQDADQITVQNLTPEQIIDYVQTQCPDKLSLSDWQPVFDALKSRDPSIVLSSLGTAWRLTAAVTFSLFGGNPKRLLPTPEELAEPGRRDNYIERVGQLLIETFVVARISIHRKGRISVASNILRLRIVANLLTKSHNSGNGGREIILHQWWKVFNERKVVKAHIFVAWTFLHLPPCMLGFFLWLAPLPEHNKSGFTVVAVMMNYVTIMIISSKRAATRKEPIALRIGSLRSPRRAIIVVLGMAISGLSGLLGSVTEGTFYGLGLGVTSATLVILITASSGLDPASTTRPMATLVNDRKFAVVIGIALGAYATLYYVTLYGLAAALMLALMCVLGSFCSSSYIRYLVAAYFGGKEGLPLRFARFLSWCHSAGLLRGSGIGYQFRHQELLDYLNHNEHQHCP